VEALSRILMLRALRLLGHQNVPACDLRLASRMLAEAADWRELEDTGHAITEDDRAVAMDGRA